MKNDSVIFLFAKIIVYVKVPVTQSRLEEHNEGFNEILILLQLAEA